MQKWNEEVFATHNRKGTNIPIASSATSINSGIEDQINRAMQDLMSMDSDSDSDTAKERPSAGPQQAPVRLTITPHVNPDDDFDIYAGDEPVQNVPAQIQVAPASVISLSGPDITV